MHRAIAALIAAAALAACASDGSGNRLPAEVTYATDVPAPTDSASSTAYPTAPTTEPMAITDLDAGTVSFSRVTTSLERPVDLAWRAGDTTLYLVEQGGTVVPVTTGADGAGVVGEAVLDISTLVSGGKEQGLLALEFHPSQPFAYANYTDLDGDTQIVEFEVDDVDGTAVIDASTRRVLLTVPQPYPNHNGGDLAFDADGMLLVSLGDGGAGGDPERLSLDLRSMLGKILRIDPRPGTGDPYGIPADNPFVDVADALAEIWSVGLRNPWRLDLDPVTGALWVADVGQGDWEEVTVVDDGRGINFGWSAWEGTHRFNGDQVGEGATPPVHEYAHGDEGCSVSGGAVLRPDGDAGEGWFVFSDYCSGRVWALRRNDGPAGSGRGPVRLDSADPNGVGLGNVSAVRRDGSGTVYVLLMDGVLLRLSVGRP